MRLYQETKDELTNIISDLSIMSSFSRILLELIQNDNTQEVDLMSLVYILQEMTDTQKHRISDLKNSLFED